MNRIGEDSPPELIAIPAIELSKENNRPVSLGLLVCEQSTVNESVRTTVGSNTVYRAGWENIFEKPSAN